MDSSPPLSTLLKRQRDGRNGDSFYRNDSVTSYEDIPESLRLTRDQCIDPVSESNRGAVMQALHNLQDKIQRLELERSGAETDMRHLASETARFRQLLNKSQDSHTAEGNSYDVSAIANEQCPKCSPRSQSELFLTQKSDAAHPDRPPLLASPLPNGYATAATPGYPVQAFPSGPTTSMELALTSAETRCTILEKQLAYMRTLLETAEHDRNEAQKRSRSRGEQLLSWRREAESNVKSLEEELRAERQRNQLLLENVQLGPSQLGRELKVNVSESRKDARREARNGEGNEFTSSSRHDGYQLPERESCSLYTSTPLVKVPETSTVKKCRQVRGKPLSGCTLSGSTKSLPRSSGKCARNDTSSKNVPFVVGRSVGPSHNVNVNLQTVLSMLNRRNANQSSSAPMSDNDLSAARRQRQLRDEMVDRQLRQDVGVVLEELVDEFDELCQEHQTLVRRLSEATEPREKTQLEHGLSDLVNRMEVKGQQIGRLRSYMASVDADISSGDGPISGGNSRYEMRAPAEALPPHQASRPQLYSSSAFAGDGINRRERSLKLLKTAKQWQACNLEPTDVSWR